MGKKGNKIIVIRLGNCVSTYKTNFSFLPCFSLQYLLPFSLTTPFLMFIFP
ncbi:MAG: hypothetical protein JETT_1002 [Candidatus Jettenia ecosi]|uniref:Uncharacterized protein n=1 Tax=Candidatus Jettenia ecosi TaxID=2494326 RepID=A0A533QDP7_9BACT|nr:MAG: hypothetical protein JETT_1002 [Candidatus Jettenia ecosi]